ncbi:hypothetical protein [Herbidospora daliensis]|uniref:hypothetical protein n=1 Tax=Herbidospora daliensis TaxID=295585 RepID=UPI0007844D5F|nr:hypothetical protein [Herbidospora daliensis]
MKGLGEDRILRAHYATQYRYWERPTTITAPKAVPGKGPETDDVADVFGAPERRKPGVSG